MIDNKDLMNALDALLGKRAIAYHRVFANIADGGVVVGVFLSQVFYWSDKGDDPEGWFYKSSNEWMEETGLTRTELETARKRLRHAGILEEKLKRNPAVLHYRLNKETLYKAISSLKETCKQDCGKPANKIAENLQTSMRKSRKQVSRKPANSLKTEITTETTPEITTNNIGAVANAPAPGPTGIFPEDDFPEKTKDTATSPQGPKRTEPEDKDRIPLEGSSSLRGPIPPPPAHSTGAHKKGDLVDGMLAYAFQPGQVDVSFYPEDIQAYLKVFCEAFRIPPKSKTVMSEYKNWINQSRVLAEACAEFGPEIINEARKEWPSHLTYSQPRSIVTVVQNLASKKRLKTAQPAVQSSYPTGRPLTSEEKQEYRRLHVKGNVLDYLNAQKQVSLNSAASQGLSK